MYFLPFHINRSFLCVMNPCHVWSLTLWKCHFLATVLSMGLKCMHVQTTASCFKTNLESTNGASQQLVHTHKFIHLYTFWYSYKHLRRDTALFAIAWLHSQSTTLAGLSRWRGLTLYTEDEIKGNCKTKIQEWSCSTLHFCNPVWRNNGAA